MNLKLVPLEPNEAAAKIKLSRSQRALELDRLAKGSILQLVYALKEIQERELFTELGYPTMRDYCQKGLNYSLTASKYYQQIVNKMGRFLPAAAESHRGDSYITRTYGENPIGDIPGAAPETEQKKETIFSTLSFKALYEISRLPEQTIEKFMETGVLSLKGKALTLETVTKADRQDLAKIISRELDQTEQSPKQKKEKEAKTLLDTRNKIIKHYDLFVAELKKFPWKDDVRVEIGTHLVPLQKILVDYVQNN